MIKALSSADLPVLVAVAVAVAGSVILWGGRTGGEEFPGRRTAGAGEENAGTPAEAQPSADPRPPSVGQSPEAPVPVPDYIPQETPVQKSFARMRFQFGASRQGQRELATGLASRYLIDQHEESFPLLKAAVERDPDIGFRAWTLLILGDLRREECADELFVPLLRDDPAWPIRHNAALGLGKLGLTKYLEALREAAAGDAHEKVRRAAEQAIRMITGETSG